MIKSIDFNDMNSLNDLNLTMPTDPQISFPDKIKVKERVTGTNKIYDFSTALGIQPYDERTIRCTFNILDFDKLDLQATHMVATQAINWLMKSTDKSKLTLDFLPDWYFMAEVENVGDLDTDVFETGEIEVVFTASPFKISQHYAGDLMFDSLNVLTDYIQTTRIQLPTFESQLPYTTLKVGDMVTIGGWAQFYSSGGAVSASDVAQYYTVAEVRNTGSVDFNNRIYSTTSYLLKEINAWVRAQDIVQARKTTTKLKLINTGINSVNPTIEMKNRPGIFSSNGITIEKDDNFYTIKSRKHNNKLFLSPGENELIIHGNGFDVDILWRSEVL